MVKIRTTKAQKTEMERVAAFLSAPLEKTQISNYVLYGAWIRQQKTNLDTNRFVVKDFNWLMSIKSQNLTPFEKSHKTSHFEVIFLW